MLKKYSLLLSVLIYTTGYAEDACSTCTPSQEQACTAQQESACATDCRRTAEIAQCAEAAGASYQNSSEVSQDAILQPCKAQIDLESMFPVESWKKFCQSLSNAEQGELRRMTEEVNSCFNKLSEELGGTLKGHKLLMEKYKKHKGITTCCYSLAFNLIPEGVVLEDKSMAQAPEETKQDFAKGLSQEEQTEFDGLQAKLQEIGKRTSAQVVEIFESNKPLKNKLLEFCKATKHTLLLTMSCDHPVLSETIKIVN